ncbi:membrane alanyl aminopeptidase-like [Anthonomus grandis grandis]|uniref:membrane alanyl aminopeptidase-like n=1 Tax=Anthonomus grandis grandis TaxID=2921223 RepID=UPI0021667BD5|nr:membrane alanyl aminopeptidase-like [Anthonomus grandis grandis]
MVLSRALTALLLLALSSSDGYRLPTVYSPSFYSINITLPSDIFTQENATSYTGTVDITFKALENVSEIVLHASAKYIGLTEITLIHQNDSALNIVANNSINATTDILTITLNDTLDNNTTYVLSLEFNGTLSTTDMYGFYKSSYLDDTNVTKYLVTTQMESTNARRAFPCFDEPRYKAQFNISLTYPAGLNALGNMEGNTTTNNITNMTTTVFEPTPVMSTYLVAFIVSDFTCTNGTLIEGSLSNQVCSTTKSNSTRSFALEVAPKVIDHLNAYLNINYSSRMTKLDQVAIPDFSAGAMENWGLITYRERLLLYDDNETSNAYKQSIAEVIAHELAHQWFGNLVTCKWWSEIFLNEGFADLFESLITNEIYPEFEEDKQNVIKTLQGILVEDASTTEALRTNVTTQSEIDSRFGGITYSKGSSVLRMVQHIMGNENWKLGLRDYLDIYQNSSAEPEDLWNTLNKNVTSLTVNLTEIMQHWINYPGFPLVTVSQNGSVLTFTQKRFVYSNSTNASTTWYVPITYTTSENSSNFDNTTPVAWLTPTDNLNVTLNSNVSWIVVNNLQTGYYRVNYDSSLRSKLNLALQQSNHSGIPEINRAQIVDDAFNLARAGYIDYSELFSTTDFLANETSYTVWYPAFNGFGYLLDRIGQNTTLGKSISNHVLNLTENLVSTVPIASTNASNHMYTLKQVLAQSWACKLETTNCTTEAVQLFEAYKNSLTRPDKNLRLIVYCYGIKNSNNISSDWEFLWNQYLNTSLSTEQVTILSALGCSNNETILKEYLNKTLIDNSGIRSQDYVSVFSAVYSRSANGVDAALDFLTEHITSIISRYTSLNAVEKILKGIAGAITTSTQIAKLENLIESNVLNGTHLEAANTGLAAAKKNLEWVSTYQSSLNSYYNLENNDTATTSSSNLTTTSSSTITNSSTTISSSTISSSTTSSPTTANSSTTTVTNPPTTAKVETTTSSSHALTFDVSLTIVAVIFLSYCFNVNIS